MVNQFRLLTNAAVPFALIPYAKVISQLTLSKEIVPQSQLM